MENSENLHDFRVILKKEEPETDIKNIKGILSLRGKKLLFSPNNQNIEAEREYSLSNIYNVVEIEVKEWFKTKSIVIVSLKKKDVKLKVHFEPLDYTSEFLRDMILQKKETAKPPNIAGLFDTLVKGGQKIAKELGDVIQKSTVELTQAIDNSSAFIRDAVIASNLLESIDFDEKNTVDLQFKSNIDEILKKTLASDSTESMILGLIAKGLKSASEQKYNDAKDALEIAKEAAESENLKDHQDEINESIKKVTELEEKSSYYDPSEIEKEAMKYAENALKTVKDWEERPDDPKTI